MLRFRVQENTSAAVFLSVGQRTAENIRAALGAIGRPIDSFEDILDFGCGCGRTLRWLAASNPEKRWHGSDVDPEAIRWCQNNFPSARFDVNPAWPPLPYADASFDLIYAVSVFTHLGEEHQRRWFEDLRRVLKPGGALLFTVFGEHVRPPLDERGFLFRTSSKLQGIVPSWYHTAFQSQEYLERALGEWFERVERLPRAMGDQDVIIAWAARS